MRADPELPAKWDIHRRAREQRELTLTKVVSTIHQTELQFSPNMAKFSDWMLGVVGATAALTVAHAKLIADTVGQDVFAAAVMGLVSSGGFGMAAKYLSLKVQAFIAIQPAIVAAIDRHRADETEEIEAILLRARALNERVRVNATMQEIAVASAATLPWWRRWWSLWRVSRNYRHPQGNILVTLRQFRRQMFYTNIQGFSLVAALSLSTAGATGLL